LFYNPLQACELATEAVSIGMKKQIYPIVGSRQQGCWHMAATLSAYGSKIAGSCRQPYETIFKR